MLATDENYLSLINKYNYLIGKQLKPENLPLLYLVAVDWKTHGEAQTKWLLQKHGTPADQTFMTESELRNQIETLSKIEWGKQHLEIIAIFRSSDGRVLFHPLEKILALN